MLTGYSVAFHAAHCYVVNCEVSFQQGTLFECVCPLCSSAYWHLMPGHMDNCLMLTGYPDAYWLFSGVPRGTLLCGQRLSLLPTGHIFAYWLCCGVLCGTIVMWSTAKCPSNRAHFWWSVSAHCVAVHTGTSYLVQTLPSHLGMCPGGIPRLDNFFASCSRHCIL